MRRGGLRGRGFPPSDGLFTSFVSAFCWRTSHIDRLQDTPLSLSIRARENRREERAGRESWWHMTLPYAGVASLLPPKWVGREPGLGPTSRCVLLGPLNVLKIKK